MSGNIADAQQQDDRSNETEGAHGLFAGKVFGESAAEDPGEDEKRRESSRANRIVVIMVFPFGVRDHASKMRGRLGLGNRIGKALGYHVVPLTEIEQRGEKGRQILFTRSQSGVLDATS